LDGSGVVKMKKLIISFIGMIVCFYTACYAPPTNNVESALDSGGRAVGITIDTRWGGSKMPYKAYKDTVSTSNIYYLESALGRYASAGYLINDSTNNITVNISVNGTFYGDDIVVLPNEAFNFNVFEIFKNLKVSSTASSNYRLVVR
jgi:hypothetical protein